MKPLSFGSYPLPNIVDVIYRNVVMLYSTDEISKDPLQINFDNLDVDSSADNELWRLDHVEPCKMIDKAELDKLISLDNSDCLYIIGNGFDLHHGLKTRYLDFRDYLKKDKKHSDLLNLLARNFNLPQNDGEKQWNIFEEYIKYSNSLPFQKGSPLNTNTKDEYCDILAAEIGKINEGLDPAFYDWIQSIENELKRKCLKNKEKSLIWENSLYLSYNYTDVLERFYNISHENIFHIHGLFSESDKESLYLGFEDLSFKLLDSYHKLISYNSLDPKSGPDMDIDNKAPKLLNMSEESKNKLLSFFTARNKKYYIQNFRCYEFNTKIVNKIKNIRRVIVLGHSFGSSDAYSLKILRDKLSDKDVEWYFGLYSKSSSQYIKNYTRMVMYKMFLTKENTKYFLW